MAVLIVGAGAAGLAAARELSCAGREVILLEARRRIGGRIFSHTEQLSTPAAQGAAGSVTIEYGAEFVHGKSPELFRLIDEAGLTVNNATERHWYFEGGKLTRSGEFWHTIEALMASIKAETVDRSFKEFLESQPIDPETQRAKDMAIRYVEGFHAANIERVSLQGLRRANQAAAEIAGDESGRILGGYSQLMRWFHDAAVKAGCIVHLGTLLKELQWHKGHVVAVCETDAGAATFKGSACLLTLPIGILQANPPETAAVSFSPELPQFKREAFSKLVMGEVLKVNLLFAERFWEMIKLSDGQKTIELTDLGFIHNPDAAFPTWWTQLPLRVPVLVGWVGGPKAKRLPRGDNGELLNQAVSALAETLGTTTSEVARYLVRSFLHDWRVDPFSRGAYGYVAVDGLSAQKILAEPLDDTLFFAGEATSEGHIGTVHGAIQSGQRAAVEVLSI